MPLDQSPTNDLPSYVFETSLVKTHKMVSWIILPMVAIIWIVLTEIYLQNNENHLFNLLLPSIILFVSVRDILCTPVFVGLNDSGLTYRRLLGGPKQIPLSSIQKVTLNLSKWCTVKHAAGKLSFPATQASDTRLVEAVDSYLDTRTLPSKLSVH